MRSKKKHGEDDLFSCPDTDFAVVPPQIRAKEPSADLQCFAKGTGHEAGGAAHFCVKMF